MMRQFLFNIIKYLRNSLYLLLNCADITNNTTYNQFQNYLSLIL